MTTVIRECMGKTRLPQVLLPVRVPPALLARAKALCRPLAKRADLVPDGTATLSTVVKHALVRGLEALERELGEKGGEK